MFAADPICRAYQSLFSHNHPEEARLVELHHAGQQADFLRAYFDHEYDKGVKTVERFARLVPDRDHGESLDFGCGAGGLTYRIAERSTRTVGIDLDPEKVAFGRTQALRVGPLNVEFLCYDGGDVPLESESFDTIFCIDVVEHLPQPARFVHEFRRLLKPGGLLFVSFGPPWPHAHGKHMGQAARLVVASAVSTSTCMRVGGLDPKMTWEDLGMFRLTVRHYERMMAASGLETVTQRALIGNRIAKMFGTVPYLRELFIGEVEGVYRKR